MSTEQIVAPGTPGSDSTPITKTTSSMVRDAFAKAPVTPAQETPAKPVSEAVTPSPVKNEAQTTSPQQEGPKSNSLHDRVAPKQEKAPDAKVEAEWPGEKLELPANASAEAKQNFSSMKAKFKQDYLAEKNARAAAEAQLATFKTAAPVENVQSQETIARLKAAEDRLMVLDLQSHPDFQKQYVQPKNQALSEAKEVLGFNNVEGDVNALLGKPLKEFNAAVSEMTKGLNTMDATTVQTALRNAYRLQNDEKGALSKAAELQSQLTAKAAQASRQAFEATAKELHGQNPFLAEFPERPEASPEQKAADLRYNEKVKSVRQKAEQYAFGKTDERGVAQMAYKSATLDIVMDEVVPRLQQEFATLHADHQRLIKEYQAIKGARSPGSLAGDNSTPAKPKSTQEMIAAAFKR